MIRRALLSSPPAWCPNDARGQLSPRIRYSAVCVARLSNREIVGCEAAVARATGSRPISSFWDGVVGQMLSVVAVGMTAHAHVEVALSRRFGAVDVITPQTRGSAGTTAIRL